MPKMRHPGIRRIGRPATHKERWSKITVVMLERQAAYLDAVSLGIRKRHRRAVPRAELVRALIEFAELSRIDFTRFSSEQEIVEFLVEYLQAIPNVRRRSPRPKSSGKVDRREESPQSEAEEVHQPDAIAHVNA